ncbi:MAG: DMT family transporter, partial [Candidatus Heimdallarchaeaceae archaeon]
NFCLKKLPAYIIGVAILGEPIGATILGIIFLKQIPDLTTILLVGLISIGIGLTSLSPYMTRKAKKEEIMAV